MYFESQGIVFTEEEWLKVAAADEESDLESNLSLLFYFQENLNLDPQAILQEICAADQIEQVLSQINAQEITVIKYIEDRIIFCKNQIEASRLNALKATYDAILSKESLDHIFPKISVKDGKLSIAGDSASLEFFISMMREQDIFDGKLNPQDLDGNKNRLQILQILRLVEIENEVFKAGLKNELTVFADDMMEEGVAAEELLEMDIKQWLKRWLLQDLSITDQVFSKQSAPDDFKYSFVPQKYHPRINSLIRGDQRVKSLKAQNKSDQLKEAKNLSDYIEKNSLDFQSKEPDFVTSSINTEINKMNLAPRLKKDIDNIIKEFSGDVNDFIECLIARLDKELNRSDNKKFIKPAGYYDTKGRPAARGVKRKREASEADGYEEENEQEGEMEDGEAKSKAEGEEDKIGNVLKRPKHLSRLNQSTNALGFNAAAH